MATALADGGANVVVHGQTAAGRRGTPDDLAGAAHFLASRASDYVRGRVLVVDGGWLAR
jgi:2-deoxy-D-gluconate 3-dehydrogenase